MIVVAGWLLVDPTDREEYLAGCVPVVEQAREAPGCLDFALTADLVDPGRVNVYERWEGVEDLHRFRGSGPDDGQQAGIREAEVSEYTVVPAAG